LPLLLSFRHATFLPGFGKQHGTAHPYERLNRVSPGRSRISPTLRGLLRSGYPGGGWERELFLANGSVWTLRGRRRQCEHSFVIDPARLQSLLAEVRRVVERRGGTAVLDLPGPADPGRLAEVAAFARTPLPPSLVELWSRHDGFELRVYGRDEAPGITTHPFIVRSTESALAATRVVRDFFAGMRECDNEDYSEEAAMRYLDVVDTDDPDHYVFLVLDQRTEKKECPIIEVSFYEDFVNRPPRPVAHSLGEFIERSLRFMIDTEGGFKYWADPDTEW
jgi:hypothetical protein